MQCLLLKETYSIQKIISHMLKINENKFMEFLVVLDFSESHANLQT